MPHRRRPGSALDAVTAPLPPRGDFRRRYADVEARRIELIDRLRMLGADAQAHPGYKRASTLLNATFRRSKLTQRLAILQAATWLIDVLEKLNTIT